MGNWEQEIFAYFEHPITNAYTESLNNLIRLTNRIGRGLLVQCHPRQAAVCRGRAQAPEGRTPPLLAEGRHRSDSRRGGC